MSVMRAHVPTQKYLETLLLYYEEEVEGEAYFEGLAGRLQDPDHKAKMMLMAKVEAYAANAVAPLLEKYGLIPKQRAELRASGQAQAEKAASDWDSLIADMRQTFPGYIDEFEGLEALAPKQDLPPLKVLTAHEVAAIAFLEAEGTRQPDPTAPMRRYLETGRA
jgi:dimethylamine/trimethylamine dehydrogenase